MTTEPTPLNVIDLMKVVMDADHETRGFALRGTTNWAAAIGKAVQDAVLAARDPADSVQEDAARYRWLRDGNDAKHGAAWHVAVNLYGCEWDAAIDAARKQGANHD